MLLEHVEPLSPKSEFLAVHDGERTGYLRVLVFEPASPIVLTTSRAEARQA